MLVFDVLNINSTPFGSASFDHQSKVRYSEPDERFNELKGSVCSTNETLPFVLFNPVSISFLASLVTTLGLCSSTEPPNSVKENPLVLYP